MDAEAKQQQCVEERDHESVLRSCQHRAERASADRVAFEAERDSELYKKAVASAAPEAQSTINDDCELERTLVERAGLRRLRETISVADLNQNNMGQALSQALMRPSTQLPQSAPAHFALSPGSPTAAVSASSTAPPVATAVTAEDIDKLAILFVTRISTSADSAERESIFTEWRNELYRQLPKWQADEVEQRARELLSVVF